jgi:predicted metalloprotease with PDZ domain
VPRFVINLDDAARHVAHVTLLLTDLAPGPHDLSLPTWQPGFYEVRDFSRHLFGVEGRERDVPIALVKTEKNRWRFTSQGGPVEIRYQVYAFELTVYGSHLDASHAYWNGTNFFFTVDDDKDVPVDVQIEAPPGWQVSTGLDPVASDPFYFRAASYDVLYDCPVEVGTHRRRMFTVLDVPHEMAVWGYGNEDLDQLEADITRIVESASRYFGGLPYSHYTFIFHVADAVGGLEHANSTTCGFSRTAFRPWASYRRVLGLIAHEFVHLWNVKRIHPEGLGPFDYDHEATLELLWTMEGITEYVTRLVLRRANLITVEEFLDGLADDIRELEQKPGRHIMSLADASYNIFANRAQVFVEPNRAISYYLKGCLVGMLLDLEIRRATRQEKSLDEVLRLLMARYGAHGVGFPEAAYRAAAEEVAGQSLAHFWHRYVNGVEEISWDSWLEAVGLRLERSLHDPDRRGNEASRLRPAWLGVEYQRAPTPIRLRAAFNPGPSAGLLYPDDEIVALDGIRVTKADELEGRVRQRRPGDRARIHLFRRGRLESVTVTLGQAPANRYRLVRRDDPGPQDRTGYERWLEAGWPESSARAPD